MRDKTLKKERFKNQQNSIISEYFNQSPSYILEYQSGDLILLRPF